ncbi:hypothetical protein [Streptomyces sp. NPDC005828]|uniref:hypothetical protein n=1 Tax=Streptomyces sp. NPDC005828 TaxID=3157071 RepID=UPI0033E58349
MTTTPNATWDLHGGTAWVFTARDFVSRPLILVGDPGTKVDDLAAAAEHSSYPLLAEAKNRGFDLILIGLDADASMTRAGGTIQRAVQRAVAERLGDAPLSVGGTAGGALGARYTLASMEYQGIDHQTALFFSHNGEAPGLEDEAELSRMGKMPQRPRTLRLIDAGADDGLADDDFDDHLTEGAGASGPLLPEAYGSWLLERLPQ